jgi:hypothetical protein
MAEKAPFSGNFSIWCSPLLQGVFLLYKWRLMVGKAQDCVKKSKIVA